MGSSRLSDPTRYSCIGLHYGRNSLILRSFPDIVKGVREDKQGRSSTKRHWPFNPRVISRTYLGHLRI